MASADGAVVKDLWAVMRMRVTLHERLSMKAVERMLLVPCRVRRRRGLSKKDGPKGDTTYSTSPKCLIVSRGYLSVGPHHDDGGRKIAKTHIIKYLAERDYSRAHFTASQCRRMLLTLWIVTRSIE
jgi:hypothetical protein